MLTYGKTLSKQMGNSLNLIKDICMHAHSLQFCLTLCNPHGCSTPGSSVHGDSPGKNTGVGCHTILQRVFQIQGSNPRLCIDRQVPYH